MTERGKFFTNQQPPSSGDAALEPLSCTKMAAGFPKSPDTPATSQNNHSFCAVA